MYKTLSFFLCVCLVVVAVSRSVIAQVESLAKAQDNASKKISGIDKSLRRVDEALLARREKNDVKGVKCLLEKRELIQGLQRASQRAKEGLSLSAIHGDNAAISAFSEKISAYAKSVEDLERTIPMECMGVLDENSQTGEALVYLLPEDQLTFTEQFFDPWLVDYVPGAETLPVIPPASPYR